MTAVLPPARGRLVVATPDMSDPNFDGTVVLLLEHGPGGALGVVLNRPSPLPVDEALGGGPMDGGPALSDATTDPDVVFVGGPVQPNAVIALASVPSVTDASRWERVFDDVGVVNIGDAPLSDVGEVRLLRIFAGYAGWGEQQLEGEIDAGAWFIVEARPEDVFAPQPKALWRSVLRRQGGLFTTVTQDPGMN